MAIFSRLWPSDGAGGSTASIAPSWRTVVGIAIATPFIIVIASAATQAVDIAWKWWKLRHIPGAPPSLLLGNLPEVIREGGSHKAIIKWREQYGNTFRMFVMNKPFVVVFDPDISRQICYRYVNHAFFVNWAARRIVGRSMLLDEEGLVQARDHFWRMLRNAWQPAFAPGTLAKYYELMVGTADELVSHINALVAGEAGAEATLSTDNTAAATNGPGGKDAPPPAAQPLPPGTVGAVAAEEGEEGSFIDIHELLNRMTLEVVGKSAYGVRFHALVPPGSHLPPDAPGPALAKACKDLFVTATMQSGSKWGLIMAMLPPLGFFLAPIARTFPDEPLIRIWKARQIIMDTSEHLIGSFRSHLAASTSPPGKLAAPAAAEAPATRPGLQVEVDQGDKQAPAGKLSGVEPGSFLALMVEADAKARAASPRTPPLSSPAPFTSPTGSKRPASFTSPEPSPGSAASTSVPSFSAASSFSGGAQPLVMTDSTIAAQTTTFILAGTETTANTLAFAIYFVCKNPEVEARLVEELNAHGPPGTPVQLDDKFPFVDAVISETLRVMPAAHATSRDMDKPGGATIGGYHIPYMTSLFVPIYGLHNSEDFWPRASEFLPERWLPQHQAELGAKNPNAYMPFGAGTRQCPGYRFALQEARIALVTLYKSYTFKLHPDLLGDKPLPVSAGITLTPRNGMRVSVAPRAAKATA